MFGQSQVAGGQENAWQRLPPTILGVRAKKMMLIIFLRVARGKRRTAMQRPVLDNLPGSQAPGRLGIWRGIRIWNVESWSCSNCRRSFLRECGRQRGVTSRESVRSKCKLAPASPSPQEDAPLCCKCQKVLPPTLSGTRLQARKCFDPSNEESGSMPQVDSLDCPRRPLLGLMPVLHVPCQAA